MKKLNENELVDGVYYWVTIGGKDTTIGRWLASGATPHFSIIGSDDYIRFWEVDVLGVVCPEFH